MLRSARSTRIAQTFTLSTAIIAAACGGEVKDVKEVVGDSTNPVATITVPGPTDSSTGTVVSSTPTQAVSIAEGEKMYQEKRYADAAALFSTYVDQRPNNPWGHYMLGLSSWKSGDLERAESAFARANAIDPKHVKTLLNLTRVHLDQGRPKDALARVNAALVLDSSSGEAYRLLGRVRSALSEPNEAVAAYRLALSHDPKDVWSMNNMGLILIQQGSFDEALGPLALAVQLDSGVATFQNNLGIALEHTGRFTLATQAFKSALAVDEGYTKAKLSLARVEGRKEDPTVTPVELTTLAESFDREIRGVQMGGPIPKN
jgi:tetratricopeptide (TPR) repeat protein